jgi:hypothetical protein
VKLNLGKTMNEGLEAHARGSPRPFSIELNIFDDRTQGACERRDGRDITREVTRDIASELEAVEHSSGK